MTRGIIIMPSTTPPASAEKPCIGTTSRPQTTMPQVMDGTPFKMSAANRIHQFNLVPPYSDRKTPPRTPTGTPMTAACASRMNVPAMALPMPPPGSPTGLGSCVKKARLIELKPSLTR